MVISGVRCLTFGQHSEEFCRIWPLAHTVDENMELLIKFRHKTRGIFDCLWNCSFIESSSDKATKICVIHRIPFCPYIGKANAILWKTRGTMNARYLVTSSPRLSNNALQLIDLRLGTTESTELSSQLAVQTPLLRSQHTRFFANLRARLSLLFRRSSMTRRSYGARLFYN
jgi:hypothetical protein